jgi:hypothetical protein
LSVLALLAFSCVVNAAPLPEGITTRSSMNAADASAVRAWAGDLTTSLQSGDAAQVTEARTTLIDALTRETSVAFRLEASAALASGLEQLARGTDETRAFNAYQIAGVLATEKGAEILLTALNSPKPTVRYGGALGTRILFQQFIAGRSPLTQEAITRQMRALAAALAKETDPVVAEGMMTPFGVQFASPAERATALRIMNDAVVQRIGSLDDSGRADLRWTRPLVRAVDSSRRLLVDLAAANQRNPDFARTSVVLAGVSMKFAQENLDAVGAERAEINNLLIASEFILLQTRDQLGGPGAAPGEQIREAIDRGNNANLRQAIERWIAPNGLLFSAPFNLPAGALGR